MKIGCLTLTWNNPEELGRVIRCFELQSHPEREMIILDDGGQYPDQPAGDRWRVVSFNRRFRTIGEKRAACVGLMSADADAIAVWDSDDVFLPHALSSVAVALESADWAQARVVLEWDNEGAGPGWSASETFHRSDPVQFAYHSGWAFTRKAYQDAGGYPPQADEDWPLARKMLRKYGPSGDSTPDRRPWLVYSRGPQHLSARYAVHLSAGAGDECHSLAWKEKGRESADIRPVNLYPLIGWDRDYASIPVPDEVHPRAW